MKIIVTMFSRGCVMMCFKILNIASPPEDEIQNAADNQHGQTYVDEQQNARRQNCCYIRNFLFHVIDLLKFLEWSSIEEGNDLLVVTPHDCKLRSPNGRETISFPKRPRPLSADSPKVIDAMPGKGGQSSAPPCLLSLSLQTLHLVIGLLSC
jgi:hypothetical protein